MTTPDKLTIEEVENFIQEQRGSPDDHQAFEYFPMVCIQLADAMREVERLRELLFDASEELRKHWFSSGDGESYNNESAISITEKIDGFLQSRNKESGNG